MLEPVATKTVEINHPFPLLSASRIAIAVLRRFDFEGYIVGGAVRDIMFGKVPSDIDIATNATPQQVIDIFEKKYGYHVVPTGIRHGTVTVFIRDGLKVEVTTYRKDGKYLDARRPSTVEFTSRLEEDLARRDFTINALAATFKNPTINPYMLFVKDYHGGLMDLRLNVLRAVGDPHERFAEDGLRVLRAVRISASLNFLIECRTYDAISLPKSIETFRKVSAERVRDELLKGFTSPDPRKVALFAWTLQKSKLLSVIIPELEAGVGMKQPKPYHCFDVFRHSVEAAKAMASMTTDPFLRLVALLHDIGKPATYSEAGGSIHYYGHDEVGANLIAQILKRLKFSGDQVTIARRLVENHLDFYSPTWSSAKVRRWIREVAIPRYDKADSGKRLPANMADVEPQMLLAIADLKAHNPEHFPHERITSDYAEFRRRLEGELNPALTAKDIAIDGRKLMTLGLQGPQVGEMKKILLERVLDNPSLNNEEELFKIAKELVDVAERLKV